MSETEATEAAPILRNSLAFFPKSMKNEVVNMDVTEVDVTFVKPRDGLIAFASVVLDDQLYLSGIAIHSKLVGSGYRLTYPTRKVGGAQFSVFHPIRRPIGLAIEHAIVEKMKNVMRKCDAGLDQIDTGPCVF